MGKASLRDDAGNSYAQSPWQLTTDLTMQAAWNSRSESRQLKYGPGSVTSDQGRVEVLLFPKPPLAVKYVDLELPGRPVGLREPVRLRVQSQSWQGAPEPNRGP